MHSFGVTVAQWIRRPASSPMTSYITILNPTVSNNYQLVRVFVDLWHAGGFSLRHIIPPAGPLRNGYQTSQINNHIHTPYRQIQRLKRIISYLIQPVSMIKLFIKNKRYFIYCSYGITNGPKLGSYVFANNISYKVFRFVVNFFVAIVQWELVHFLFSVITFLANEVGKIYGNVFLFFVLQK